AAPAGTGPPPRPQGVGGEGRARSVMHHSHLGLGRRGEPKPHGLRPRRAPHHAILLTLEPGGDRHDDPVAHLPEHLEAPVDQRTAATHGERLGPGGTKAFAAAGRGNDPDDGHAWMLYLAAAAAAPSRSAHASSIRLSMYSSASPSSISRAYISSEARIFLARVNICFSPVESPLSFSRIARLRTTSASSKTSPVLILSRLC